MKTIHKILFSTGCIAAMLLFATGCTEKADLPEPAPILSGLEPEYFLTVNDKLTLSPKVGNRIDSIVWWIDGQRVANALTYTFDRTAQTGTYRMLVRAYNEDNITQQAFSITIEDLSFRGFVNTVIPLEISKKFEGKDPTKIVWEVMEPQTTHYRIALSETGTPLFCAIKPGLYKIKAAIDDLSDVISIRVLFSERMQTPYISKVFHYLPAPGQFVNKLPKYEDGDTQEVMNLKAEALIAGEKNELVTLGGWGGCIVFGFDHTIVNVAGKRDFRILGNAFGANANPRPDPPFGGSCEPGIIMVAYDKNKNGKPDEDEWYEIRGSGNMTAEGEPWYQIAKDKGQDVATYRDYEMTYFRPTSETPQEAGEIDNPGSFTTIKEYIRWKDNQGKEGYKIKNVYHDQSYYPGWIKDDQITYKGIRIADNGISEKEDGSYYVLYAYRYGYVDNFPNLDARSAIDIDWAVDKNGNKVHLPGIDFVKVYNGVDKENGWLGEASTEVAGGQDLHMLEEDVDTIEGI